LGYAARPTPVPTSERRAVGTVRVTLADGAQYDLKDAYVQGDSLIGMTRQTPNRRVAVAVPKVTTLESYGFRWLRAGALAVGIYLGLGLLVGLLLLGSWE
jgi:hypothetical protein